MILATFYSLLVIITITVIMSVIVIIIPLLEAHVIAIKLPVKAGHKNPKVSQGPY